MEKLAPAEAVFKADLMERPNRVLLAFRGKKLRRLLTPHLPVLAQLSSRQGR